MTRESTGPKRDSEPTADQVLRYLRTHPEFLQQNPDVMSQAQAPARDLGTGVVDLQQAMIERTRREIAQLKDRHRDLIGASRENLSTQARIHECVLSVLGANSFEEMIQVVTTDFAVLLDLDIVTLCIEADDPANLPINTRGLQLLPPGKVEAALEGRSIALNAHVAADPDIYGGGAALVRSEALARLDISSVTPPALIAFGTRRIGHFGDGQATELMTFLSQVLEHVVRGWLHLPR